MIELAQNTTYILSQQITQTTNLAKVSDVSNTAVQTDAPCEATVFSQSPKLYGDVTYGDKTIESFHQSSAPYDPDLCDFDALARELFKQNEMWASRDLLLPAVKTRPLSMDEKQETSRNTFNVDTQYNYHTGPLTSD